MIGISMLYICVASGCIAITAVFVERALRESHIPARFVWLVSMIVTLLSISWVPSRRVAVARPSDVVQAVHGTSLHSRSSQAILAVRGVLKSPSVIAIDVSQTAAAARLDFLLMLLWATASTLTLIRFGVGATRLHRIEATAERVEIDGVSVLMTIDTGPLAFGVVRPRIVLPKWFSELGANGRNLIIAHEREHIRRADPALLVIGAAMTALMPWNPVMWYMLARVRNAVELDCDTRVLSVHPDRRVYADLLLSIAGRARGGLLPVAGLAFTTSSLERRFLLMTQHSKRTNSARVALLAGAGVLFAVTTAMVPRPEGHVARSTLPLGMKQPNGRATGRVHIASMSDSATYRVYSRSGKFAVVGELPRLRADTLSGVVYSGLGAIVDVDVTDGDVYIVGAGTNGIRVDAAMLGSSPATWVSASGKHIAIDRGGVGIRRF